MDSLHDILRVSRQELSTSVAGARRLARVQEAISWPIGTKEELSYESIFSYGDYSIKLGKPGKEAALDYALSKYKDGHKGNNPNDMKPSIFKGNERLYNQASTFTEIFEELERFGVFDKSALELVACLLFRSAYMLDHKETAPGVWRYEIPNIVLKEITDRIPIADDLPMVVFLHFLDALAWNEDVKYHTLGFDIRLGFGRKNNLLTCVNLIGVLLKKVSIAKFAGNFGRPPAGIAAISNKEALKIFPLLA